VFILPAKKEMEITWQHNKNHAVARENRMKECLKGDE